MYVCGQYRPLSDPWWEALSIDFTPVCPAGFRGLGKTSIYSFSGFFASKYQSFHQILLNMFSGEQDSTVHSTPPIMKSALTKNRL